MTVPEPARSVPRLPEWARTNVWSVQWWEQAWASPVSGLWQSCDIPALARLAVLHGEVAARMLEDSKLLSEIRALEDRFLLNPNARRIAGVALDDRPELVSQASPVKIVPFQVRA
jgi:hypothetical protein